MHTSFVILQFMFIPFLAGNDFACYVQDAFAFYTKATRSKKNLKSKIHESRANKTCLALGDEIISFMI